MDVYKYGNADADIVLVQPVDNHDLEAIENEVQFIMDASNRDFCLIAVKVHNWNADLSPWEAPAVFGKDNFGGGASGTLEEVLSLCSDQSKTYYIGGYSLAGLFALWSAYQTNVFSGVAAASPSVWFRGFDSYMKEHEIKSRHVYLSLGNTENKTRNAVMATVKDKLCDIYEWLKGQNVNCILEWNEGNHFKDADYRTAKAFAWLLNQWD